MSPAPHPAGARRPIVGRAVFAVTLIAVLAFFWWLLIYDHGVPPAP